MSMRLLREPDVETSDKTVKLPCYVSALLSFFAAPLWGTDLSVPLVVVSSAVSGQAPAITVSVAAPNRL